MSPAAAHLPHWLAVVVQDGLACLALPRDGKVVPVAVRAGHAALVVAQVALVLHHAHAKAVQRGEEAGPSACEPAVWL
jgi:hypothetical protein